jgi:hypothetical protein
MRFLREFATTPGFPGLLRTAEPRMLRLNPKQAIPPDLRNNRFHEDADLSPRALDVVHRSLAAAFDRKRMLFSPTLHSRPSRTVIQHQGFCWVYDLNEPEF